MTARGRLARLERALAPPAPPRCLTLFYVAVAAGEPTGVTEAWAGAAREVRYTAGTPFPRLPGGPNKLVRGPAVEV